MSASKVWTYLGLSLSVLSAVATALLAHPGELPQWLSVGALTMASAVLAALGKALGTEDGKPLPPAPPGGP